MPLLATFEFGQYLKYLQQFSPCRSLTPSFPNIHIPIRCSQRDSMHWDPFPRAKDKTTIHKLRSNKNICSTYVYFFVYPQIHGNLILHYLSLYYILSISIFVFILVLYNYIILYEIIYTYYVVYCNTVPYIYTYMHMYICKHTHLYVNLHFKTAKHPLKCTRCRWHPCSLASVEANLGERFYMMVFYFFWGGNSWKKRILKEMFQLY